MKFLSAAIPRMTIALLAAFLLAMAMRTQSETTIAIVASSLLMFAFSWASACHLLGVGPASRFAVIALTLGWFAEQMGVSRGWFFGHYVYTDVLGWRVGDVPAVIPLMWFALCYAAYVISNLIVWRSPRDDSPHLANAVFMSFMAAMVVTAFDLGADPYMVYQLKAWTMAETDGWWFGETIQGFFGWVTVAFTILLAFRLSIRNTSLFPLADFNRWHALLPVAMYGGGMVFQMCVGFPMETRTIAAFAMGIPILSALAGWRNWQPVSLTAPVPSPVSNARLEQMQYIADPLADGTMAAILGIWPESPDAKARVHHIQQIALVNRQLESWSHNATMPHW